MLLNVFRNQRPASSIIVLILFLVFWLPGWFLRPIVILPEGGMPLFLFVNHLIGNFPWLLKMLSAFGLLASAIIFNGAINRQDFFKTSNNLTLFFIVFLSFSLPDIASGSPAHLALPFLCLSLGQLFKLYFDEGSLLLIFNASLYLSIGTLFYGPLITFLPLLPITLVINGRADWRHVTVIALGLMAPVLIVGSSWIWIPDSSFPAYLTILDSARSGNMDLFVPVSEVPLMISILIVMVISGVELSLNLDKKRVSNRKNFLLMIWASIFGMLGFALAPANQLTHLVVLTVPVGLLLSNFFYYIRQPRLGNVAIVLILISALISVFTP